MCQIFVGSVNNFGSTANMIAEVLLTPARTLSISGLKSRVLKFSFLSLKMMVKSGLEFILKLIPSEIPAKLPGQFSHSGQIFLPWAAATLKGPGRFQNKF